MPKQKIEIEVDIPDGYRFVRFGKVQNGEQYLADGDVLVWESDESRSGRAIVEPLPKRYREPDARDVGKACEVSDANGFNWHKRTYIGRTKSSEFVTEDDFSSLGRWIQARVVDDSPTIDIGDDYRLADERDIGKVAQFSNNGCQWQSLRLNGCGSGLYFADGHGTWRYARVLKDDEPAICVGVGYRMADERDIGRDDVEFSDSLQNWVNDGKLFKLNPNSTYDFEGETFSWRYARVKVDQ